METNNHKDLPEENHPEASSEKISYYFTGRHTSITDSIRFFVKDRLKKLHHLLKKDHPIKVNVIASSIKTESHARITITTPHYTDTSTGSHKELYSALEEACSNLLKTLSRRHERSRDHRHNSLSVNEALLQDQISFQYSNEILEKEIDEAIDTSLFDLFPGNIIQEKSEKIKTLTTKEVIIDMRLNDTDYRIFRNSENSSLSMIYRRQDGNYGLIKLQG
ncbi:ribosome hibernation-promoting factor, HPF/YfiA family [Candidatus Clavichlamydia salmonicola]|uniref:ribosome hibernation-promoting factor, HPF/YfiA family n=1 Tax=Candidatus Clavichlamydia salmonicola TaxID=469812 RepID=UPI0018916B71|nr:ribosome-associated translation inhibitor RaiA [Candidatus Clavichlamydia salmonicola]